MKKHHLIFGLITIFLLSMSSCAPVQHISHCVDNNVYGFWGGLWHGSIMFFSLIGEIFSDNISIYAVNNNGGWYDFGFVIGIGGLFKIIVGILQLIGKALFG